jgi:hypothetical protein
MTLAEARAHIGARVTHHATGVIQDVTDHYIWIRVDGDETALKSAKPETLTLDELVEDEEPERNHEALAHESRCDDCDIVEQRIADGRDLP